MKQGWITDSRGDRYHYVDDKLHNDNGPAIIRNDGGTCWCKNHAFHREDGPAIEYSDGIKSWWYEGKFLGYSNSYSQEEFDRWIRFRVFL